MLKHLIIGMLVIGNYTQHSAKRTVLLFADKSSQGVLKQQEQMLMADKAGLQQRDVEVMIYDAKSAAAKTNHIRSGFTVLLIGKDNGEKLRSHLPVTTKKLFGLIDAMPMRKEEMMHAAYQEE
jgi:hypothetical protein